MNTVSRSRARFDLVQNHQLIMVRPIGAWSETIATQFVQKINVFLNQYNGQIAGLIDLRLWELGTPRALQVIGKNSFHAASLGYCLEIHYGEPKAIPLQISKEKITPDTLTLVQTKTVDDVKQALSAYDYPYDPALLSHFLDVDS